MLFLAAVCFLLLLTVQTLFHPIRTVSLSGFVLKDTLLSPTLANLSTMNYQRSANKVVTKTFGFREAMIRIHNQAMYNIFDECGPFVLKGKDGYLFERSYIPAVCGDNFLGTTKLQSMSDSLVQLNELLNDHGKKFLFIIAPNKLRYHRNKLNLSCDGKVTNYTELRSLLNESEVPFLDFIDEFEEQEHQYPLFSKSGSHWSLYGASLAAQRIQERLHDLGVSEGRLDLKNLVLDVNPRKTDKDLHGLLNVMTKPKEEELAYPTLAFHGEKKTKALIVGDSYYTMFIHLGIVNEMFDPNSRMLYYNRSVMLNNDDQRQELTHEMRVNALRDAEVVILLSNEDAITTLGWGFINEAILTLNE